MPVMERQALPYQLLPPLSDEEYQALRDDIRERGVQIPVEFDEQGEVLDGHHRIQACRELGIEDFPRLVRRGLTEEGKRSHVRALNLNRRHLNQEQKRGLIGQQLRETPHWSDRKIAALFGVSPTTVGGVRAELVVGVQIGQSREVEASNGVIHSREWRDPEPTAPPEESLSSDGLSDEQRAIVEEVAREAYREAEAHAIEALSSRNGTAFLEAEAQPTEADLPQIARNLILQGLRERSDAGTPAPIEAPPVAEGIPLLRPPVSKERWQAVEAMLTPTSPPERIHAIADAIEQLAASPLSGAEFRQQALPWTLQQALTRIPQVRAFLDEIEKGNQ